MKTMLGQVLVRIDTLTVRERVVGFVMALAIAYGSWNMALFGPLEQRRSMLSATVWQLHEEIQALNAQVGKLAMLRALDPDAANRERLVTLRAETTSLKQTIDDVAARLVPPKEMATVLEAVLTRETGLELVKLQGVGATPMLTTSPAPSKSPETDTPADAVSTKIVPRIAMRLFKHGLEIRFQGEYLQARNYLLALESLAWDFLWESVDLQVTRHPLVEVEITVFSLSLDEAWIGV